VEDLAARVSFPESFQVGRLSFRLPETLEAGKPYRLVLEASDNLDHRTSIARDFTLAGSAGEEFALSRIYNVPNPLEDAGTTFFIEMNRKADVTIRIFTASGARIREIRAGEVTPEAGVDHGIDWDGRDEDGDRLANGVYFYKLIARSEDGRSEDRVERLAVLR
jgi:flagellar hook assembly protein FlgD